MKSELSLMAQAAVELNEVYLTFQQAGFTEKEALYLVGKILTNTTQGGEQ